MLASVFVSMLTIHTINRMCARCEKKGEAHDMIIESRCSLIIVDHPEMSERCSAKFLFLHISVNLSTAMSHLPYCRYSSEIKWLFFSVNFMNAALLHWISLSYQRIYFTPWWKSTWVIKVDQGMNNFNYEISTSWSFLSVNLSTTWSSNLSAKKISSEFFSLQCFKK